jgi:hypothetical protein
MSSLEIEKYMSFAMKSYTKVSSPAIKQCTHLPAGKAAWKGSEFSL